MTDTFDALTRTPPKLTPEDCHGLAGFIAANLHPRIRIVAVSVSTEFYHIKAHLSPDDDANDAALAALVDLYLSGDLVTIADAAAACNVGIKRISAAVSVGALRGYTNPAAPNPRKGGTLVSLAACRQMWGSNGTPTIGN